MAKSKIEWTDRTWNPITGCSHVSEACRFCYAERQDRRLMNPGRKLPDGFKPWTEENARYNVQFHRDRLDRPLHWKKPQKVFPCSISDLFHPLVTDAQINMIFSAMALAHWHTFQIVTKRTKRAKEWIMEYQDRMGAPLRKHAPNIWVGTTVENEKALAERAPELVQIAASVLFLSLEPLLEEVDILPFIGGASYECPCGFHYTESELIFTGGDHYTCPDCNQRVTRWNGIQWVIAGGESGPDARPSHPDWFRRLQQDTQAAGVPFFFKQWGEWIDEGQFGRPDQPQAPRNAGRMTFYGQGGAGDIQMIRAGKKRAGAVLDGIEYKNFPEISGAIPS